MTLQLFFNDLATPDEPCSREAAVAHLKQFVGAIRAASAISSQFVVNGQGPLADLSFGPNWPLAALRNSAGCMDESLYLKTVQDRFPHSQTIADLRGPVEDEVEYRLCADASIKPGSHAPGLGLAHHFNGLAISLPSHPFWECLEIDLDRTNLQLDGELATERVRTRNACSNQNVLRHQEALRHALRPRARDGADLWREREHLLPNLRFIPRTRGQIEAFQHGDPIFEAVLDRLADLDQAIGLWVGQNLARPNYTFNVRPESRTRIKLTEFRDAEGVQYEFSDHADFTPGEGRIHFIILSQPRRHALVGHVGRKLGIG